MSFRRRILRDFSRSVMQLEIRRENDVLWCSGSLDISAAAELGKRLAEALGEKQRVTLDLSEIAECDAAGLQVLYSAKKQADISGATFRIGAPSAAVQERSADLGLAIDALTLESAHV